MAFVSKEIIDEIKARNDIVDVIGSYISLNEKYKGLCPFHDDHTPSFSVHPDKQIYKCFSCGESGNVITFVEKFNQVSFAEALSILAERAGVRLDITQPKKVNAHLEKYYDINDTVNKYFKNNLISTVGKEARDYLSKRKIDKEIINEFNIGLSTSNKLTSILEKKYDIKDLMEIDITKEINGKYYDTFQNRIMFPIIDENNNIVGFSGRKYLTDDIKDERLPRYSNSKENIIFKKSGTFYNINNALPNIKKSKEIVITEGFMDTIRMASIGYKNVIALMGTAFNQVHLEKILKYKCKVIMNLDQDDAGVEATIKIGDELLKHNLDVSVVVFEDYKDSDEYIVNKGKDAFDTAFKNRISYIDFKLNYLKSTKNMKDSVEISKYINEAINALNEIDDTILRELKTKELSEEFGIDVSVIKNKLKEPIKVKEEPKKEEKKKRYDKYDISEIRLLYLMMHYDDVLLYFENTLGYMVHKERASLAYRIIEFRNQYGYFDYSDFIDYIEGKEVENEVLKEVMRYHNEEEYTEKELDDYINTIKMYTVEKRKRALKQQLKETLDINKKKELGLKIENINKEVLKW